MRLLTWNLDHSLPAVRDEQSRIIADLRADIEVLTEPGPPEAYKTSELGYVASPARRSGGEPWVVIRGINLEPVDFKIPYKRMAAAALANIEGHDLIIYGAVLPWNAAASQDVNVFDLPAKGVPSAAIYGSWLTDQLRDIWKLGLKYPDHKILWVGDFNVPLLGPIDR